MTARDGGGTVALATPQRAARTPRLVGAAWALLIVDTIGSGGDGVIPIPRHVAQVVTMGALVAALVIALLLNPRARIRPNLFLLLITVLAAVSVLSSVSAAAGIGSYFRCVRLLVFVGTLWLLTPWWDDAVRFVRHHVTTLCVLLLTVVVGMVVAPGIAFPEQYSGRLAGAVWYFPPPRVAEYSAVAAGLVLLLWMGRRLTGRDVLLVAVPALALLLLTHTRTSTIALIAGLTVAALTLFLSNARARRALTALVLAAGLAAVAFGAAAQAWFRRGQGNDVLSTLTGRQNVWDALLAQPRTGWEQTFGTGLSNMSFNGHPIDSSWLATYQQLGLLGVALIALLLGALLVTAAVRPPSVERAVAVFLIVYCGACSYTEVGIGGATTFTMHLALAAALLTPREPAPDPSQTEESP